MRRRDFSLGMLAAICLIIEILAVVAVMIRWW